MLREFVCSFLVLCFSVKVCPSTTIDLQARCVRTAGFLFSHEICFAHDTQGRALSTAPLLDSAPDAEQIKFDRLVNEMRSAHGSVHQPPPDRKRPRRLRAGPRAGLLPALP